MAELQPLLPRKIPQGLFPPIGDAPPVADLDSMGTNPLGSIAAPPSPNVVDNPRLNSSAADSLVRRAGDLNADLYRRENPIKPTTTLGKIGHVAANIGNVLGNIVAPAEMSLIHGTQLNNEVEKNRDRAGLDQVSQLQTEEAQRALTKANTEYTQHKPEIAMAGLQRKMDIAQLKADQNAALHGQRRVTDPDTGEDKYVDDPDLLAHSAQQAQIELRNAQTELANSKNDPSSPEFQQAERRVAVARANAQASQIRANAYMGNYMQHAFNKDLQGNVLPGAPKIADENGNQTTVGSTNAPQAVKAQANAAQFGDVGGALDDLETKAKALVQNGGKLNSPAVIYALQHTQGGTLSQMVKSLDKSNLSPEERDYVISNLAAHENVQALRKSAGGTATDSSVAKLDALLPGGETPDIDYLLNQTKQIRQTAGRLGKGVTTVQGGLHVDTSGGSSEKVKKYNPATGRLE